MLSSFFTGLNWPIIFKGYNYIWSAHRGGFLTEKEDTMVYHHWSNKMTSIVRSFCLNCPDKYGTLEYNIWIFKNLQSNSKYHGQFVQTFNK